MEIDKEILISCKKYNREALAYLFSECEKYLYNLCYGYTQNASDALDLVQEIYIKIFKGISTFNEDMPFQPWLRRVAVNTCLNFKRHDKRNVVSLNFNYNDEYEKQDMIASDYNMEELVITRSDNKLLRDNIKKLSYDYRMIITLRFYEELSYGEIAELLKIPIGTVKTKLYRAKNLLKKNMKDELEVRK